MTETEQLLVSTLKSVGVVAGDSYDGNVTALCRIFNRAQFGAPYDEDPGIHKMTLGEAIRYLVNGATLEIGMGTNDDGSHQFQIKMVEDLDAARDRTLRESPELGVGGNDFEVAPKVIGLAVRNMEVHSDTDQKDANNLQRLMMDIQFIDAFNAIVLHREGLDNPMLMAGDVGEE